MAGRSARNCRRRPRGRACSASSRPPLTAMPAIAGSSGRSSWLCKQVRQHAAARSLLRRRSGEDERRPDQGQMPGQRRHHVASRRLPQDAESLQTHAEIFPQRRLAGIAGMNRMDPSAEIQRQLKGPGVVVRAAAAARGWMPADGKKYCNIKTQDGAPWPSRASAGMTACASAMMARSARFTISAWRSVFTASTRSQRRMPCRCCGAPAMPKAR